MIMRIATFIFLATVGYFFGWGLAASIVQGAMAFVMIDQHDSILRLRTRLRTVERHLVLDDNE